MDPAARPTRPKACTRRATFLRGSSLLTVNRNGPATPACRRSALGGADVGWREVVGAAGSHGDPASDTPEATRSAASRPEGTTKGPRGGRPRPSAAPCQRAPRRVVASGCRRQATSWTVTIRRSELECRSWGEARETECTTSNPAGARDNPWSQARVKSRPGSRDVRSGPAESGQRIGAPSGGRLASSATSTPSPSVAAPANPPSKPRA